MDLFLPSQLEELTRLLGILNRENPRPPRAGTCKPGTADRTAN